MSDKLEGMALVELRKECRRRGILFPCGTPLPLASTREVLSALRSPEYAEAMRLGLLTQEDE